LAGRIAGCTETIAIADVAWTTARGHICRGVAGKEVCFPDAGPSPAAFASYSSELGEDSDEIEGDSKDSWPCKA